MTAINEGRLTLAISDFVTLFNEGHLILDPAFQRSHAWNGNTRSELVESVLNGNIIPEILLFKPSGSDSFIVIDGKQRMETLLSFAGMLTIPGSGPVTVKRAKKSVSLAELEQTESGIKDRLMAYRLGVVVCSGNESEAAALFLAWNKCSGLKPSEVRNARFCGNPLYAAVRSLSESLATDFNLLGIVKESQPDRMEREEIVSELLCSCYAQALGQTAPLSGKDGVNRILEAAQTPDPSVVERARREVEDTIRFMGTWYTPVKETRFRYRAAFHTLFMWTKLALAAGYGETLNQENGYGIKAAITKLSCDLLAAARKTGTPTTLLSDEEARRFLSTLNHASDSKTAREVRMDLVSVAFSRALAGLIGMEAFPSVEEMAMEVSQTQLAAAAA